MGEILLFGSAGRGDGNAPLRCARIPDGIHSEPFPSRSHYSTVTRRASSAATMSTIGMIFYCPETSFPIGCRCQIALQRRDGMPMMLPPHAYDVPAIVRVAGVSHGAPALRIAPAQPRAIIISPTKPADGMTPSPVAKPIPAPVNPADNAVPPAVAKPVPVPAQPDAVISGGN